MNNKITSACGYNFQKSTESRMLSVKEILQSLPYAYIISLNKRIFINTCTVKHSYSEHAYNELTPTAEGFSFSVTLLNFVNLSDITNYAYIKAKSPVLGTLL